MNTYYIEEETGHENCQHSENEIKRDGLVAMAKEAIKRGTGARALRSIFEKLMLDVMFECPSQKGESKVVITKAMVEGSRTVTMKPKSSGKEGKQSKDAA